MIETKDQTKKFNNFLKFISGQKEVSLVIAKNTAEVKNYVQSLEIMGLHPSKNAKDLMSKDKTYLMLGTKLDKDIYDFVVQYPTGQVQLFDKKSMTSLVSIPSYRTASVVFIVLKNNLKKIQKGPYDLLSNVGLTFQ